MPDVDVLIVGGGAAGLAAAVQLGRSRRSVVVVDAGEPRNAPASHMHGYLGYDGRPPGELLARGRVEAEAYGVRIVDGRADALAALEHGGFRAELADGRTVTARRLLVATGLVDELPEVPGVAEQWGRGVLHCPYCHGWEVRDRAIVVIGTGAMAVHQALLFRQLTERVTLALHDGPTPEGDERRRLDARGIPVLDGPVVEVVLDGDAVTGVRLADGTHLPADAVVVQPRFVARAGLLAGLGVATAPRPMGSGDAVDTDARGETSVPGVYAAGNVHDVSQQVLQAAAEGSRVAAQINADLVLEDADQIVTTSLPPTPPEARSRSARAVSASG